MIKFHPVLLFPSAKEITVEEGVSVLEAVRRAGLYLRSDCNGRGRCGSCRVRHLQGLVGPVSEAEQRFLSPGELHKGYRLACRISIQGAASFQIPEEHFLNLAGSEKGFVKRVGPLRPAVKEYLVPWLPFPRAPETVAAAIRNLETHHGLKGLTFDPSLPQTVFSPSLDDGSSWTARVWMDRELIELSPGIRPTPLGLALDLGTTTVAVYLWDLATGEPVAQGAFTNPQVRFGPDIMSRIAWSVNHPGHGAEQMHRELIEALNDVIGQTALRLGLSPKDIVDASVVGNPVMHHLFLGLPPDRMGRAPFTPIVREALDQKAGPLGLAIHASAYVHLLPLIGGFVGSDALAVILAEGLHHSNEFELILDLGTNGEIILGDRERLYACSCATGPAFEGSQLSCGMRAVPGAIERIRLHPTTFDPDYQVVGRTEWAAEMTPKDLWPAGICGSGVIDLLADLLKNRLVEKNGTFSEKIKTPRLRRNPSGEREFLVIPGGETLTGRDIVLTQKDIRQVQLAKAAVYAGCKVLMARFSQKTLRRIRIAGAFGQHLDPQKALALGLLPSCPIEEIVAVGNAAGQGACLTLLDREKRKEAAAVARQVLHVELAREPLFQKEFLQAMNFP